MINDTSGNCEQKKRYIIGLTGPIAAGKNVAADILESKGFKILDADRIAHEILDSHKKQIIALFENDAQEAGIGLTHTDGSIHRKHLGQIVFHDRQKLIKLEHFVHPLVEAEIRKAVAEKPDTSFIVNAALLYKIPIVRDCDCILYISAPFFIRFMRVKKRDNLHFKYIIERFYAQRQIFTKCKKQNADIYRVGNCGTKKRLQEKIEAVLQSSIYKG
ncbi:dephospho-CoA kinase [Treponema sp. OMZ 840]|uniref:dephospho-CoA kinase n=1 Tax=Treponema sp. OMZ 840 TaxID=244313 RepID=UPI003D8A4917